MASAPSVSPAVQLRPYQAAWVRDGARRKIACKSRRIGFTFGTTLEIAMDAAARRTKWLIVSRTQDTAKEALEECATHLRAMRMAERSLKGMDGIAVEEVSTDLFFEGVQVKTFQIDLPNRSRIMGVTAAPDALRGFGGNVFLDEFAFHKKSTELWRAAATATMLGHRLIVVSTPNYQQGKYYDLCRKTGLAEACASGSRKAGMWSAHWVDLAAAVEQGFPVSIDDCRELAGDEDTFAQEYCCVFLADGECFISADMISAVESVDATLDYPLAQCAGPLYLGMDIGRRKDRTVIWCVERVGDVLVTRVVKTLVRTPFSAQEDELYALLPFVQRAAIDATGMGMQLGERARAKFGAKVEPIEFTQAIKERMAIEVKRMFEERLVRIPESPAIRSSIGAVKRYASTNGALRFDAARTDQGHADEFWALALAASAAHEQPCSMRDAQAFGSSITGELAGMRF